MNFDPDEAAFARALLGCGRRRTVVSDANKFSSEALVVVCALAGIDRLVTDAAPPSDLAEALDEAQVEVTVAE